MFKTDLVIRIQHRVFDLYTIDGGADIRTQITQINGFTDHFDQRMARVHRGFVKHEAAIAVAANCQLLTNRHDLAKIISGYAAQHETRWRCRILVIGAGMAGRLRRQLRLYGVVTVRFEHELHGIQTDYIAQAQECLGANRPRIDVRKPVGSQNSENNTAFVNREIDMMRGNAVHIEHNGIVGRSANCVVAECDQHIDIFVVGKTQAHAKGRPVTPSSM